ncbi:hypothetical protein GIB67_028795 [Kingdonia uniflora]|uniref:Cytochrome P450 n=1 Tax=Kingdonia uniflora TaxID=39325 RepID=A0A7J7LB97_9MAGN|nr:hypothetical protein GIB67_028795 [Kingdonia uniflora]
MTMIINETLRLYPPVLGMTRTASREIRLGDLLLPADIELVILCLVTHNDPEIWGEDAHLSKLDRFAEGITKAAKNTMAYLPFGLGPRTCVGSNFAMIEVKLALSMILQRCTFTVTNLCTLSSASHRPPSTWSSDHSSCTLNKGS